jgi:hypothetical protein
MLSLSLSLSLSLTELGKIHISIQEPNLVKSPTVWEMLLTNLDGRSLYAFLHV